jgi:hypothetical protein
MREGHPLSEHDDCIRCRHDYRLEDVSIEHEFVICNDCTQNLNPSRETVRVCPIDGREMKKLIIYDLVLIDKCTTCGGIWLDQNELKLIARIVGVNAAVGGYLMGNIANDL